MKRISLKRLCLVFWIFGCLPLGACGGRALDRKAAEKLMARAPLGLSREDDAVIESIGRLSADDSIIEARIKAALKVEKDKRGEWVIREVRLGDRPWERLEDIILALDRVKADRTRSMLESVAAAIARYRAERGGLPDFQDFEDLADRLHPAYLSPLVRVDPWQRPFLASRTGRDAIRLSSRGPDGEAGTADDIPLERSFAP